MSGAKELLAFLFAGAGAIVRFWAPPHGAHEAELEPEAGDEPAEPAGDPRMSDRIDAIAAKMAPYPGQEG